MNLKILYKYGSKKTGEDTLLFNMGSATRCPSKARCRVLQEGRSCYPAQIESHHPEVRAFRDRQAQYWQSTPGEKIAQDILDKISRHDSETRFLRFNESGDFYSQECVEKLSCVAMILKAAANITSYGFTARDDLDFSQASFLVKGSGHDSGNNGRCTVIDADAAVPDGFALCPENCRECKLCMQDTKVNIAFIER